MIRSLRTRALLTAALVALVGPSVALPGAAAPADVQPYIVVLTPAASDVPAAAAALARSAGGQVGHVYEHALKGFSLTAAPAAAAGLARNPLVDYVEPDRVVTLAEQALPTGIERTFAAGNPAIDIDGKDEVRVDVGVAVIDTGIDRQHPDLNVVDGINCAQGWPFGKATCSGTGDDDHYHGTHVAGTIAALDNGDGVVGMAPGARLYAVKVLNKQGSGYTSWIVAGIDWVAARAGLIKVANMSLSGAGFSQAEYNAIQGAVDKGVAFAVAAGNEAADASGSSPAGFNNVLTVSALADFDGIPGALGASTCRADQDDTLADFSNRGSAVDVAAPGVCIKSTYPLEQGSYGTISGTSMASPHVAGALALLASATPPANEADVHGLYGRIRSSGNDNWTDDSGDGIQEPLLDVTGYLPKLGESGGNPPPAANLAGSAAWAGSTWTATVTLTGAAGASTSGSWSTSPTKTVGCTIPVNAASCSFSLAKISAKKTSVTYTDPPPAPTGSPVNISRP